jgi:hypothetical protein
MKLNFFSRIKTKILELKQKIEFRKFHLLTVWGSWYSYYPFELSWFDGLDAFEFDGFEDNIYYPFSLFPLFIFIPLPFFREDTYYLEDYHEYHRRISERLEHMEYMEYDD